MRIFPVLLTLLGFAHPVGAQIVSSDLNGDGRPERFSLIDANGTADLQIENTGGGVLIAENIVWVGGMSGQKPELDAAANGSILVTSMNEAIGRDRWRLTLTIAHRQGGYMVVGYTYSWYDTLDPENNGTCDLNLLTGRGFLTQTDRPAKSVNTKLRAMPVTSFKDDHPIPEVCGSN